MILTEKKQTVPNQKRRLHGRKIHPRRNRRNKNLWHENKLIIK
jgi:hypothetical protein